MSREVVRFVVVGSVDHGKSTIIGRLLHDTGSLSEAQLDRLHRSPAMPDGRFEWAFLLDHFAEERFEGMTIETTQATFSHGARDYVAIDAPGHKEFIKNMVTGASQASAAVLVLDAREGPTEQTRRHAFILSLLGLKTVTVVLNKMDQIAFRSDVFGRTEAEARALCRRLSLEVGAVVPVAALQGENLLEHSSRMPWYRGPTLAEALSLLEPSARTADLPLRLPIQDVYQIAGEQVAAGRVASGRAHVGQEVLLCPDGYTTKIVTLRKHPRRVASAGPGESVGVTLSNGGRLVRGQVLSCPSRPPSEVRSITATMFWMSSAPLKRRQRVAVRLATQQLVWETVQINDCLDSGTLEVRHGAAAELHDTEVAQVTLRGREPLVTDSFNVVPELGRLVLMRRGDVVAGGVLI